jgi:hypothetical protein
MDLPVELRLMVYERLPRKIKQYVIHHTNGGVVGTAQPLLTVVKKSVATSILATCKTVHKEANGLLQKTIPAFILESTPKLFLSLGEGPGQEPIPDQDVWESLKAELLYGLTGTVYSLQFSAARKHWNHLDPARLEDMYIYPFLSLVLTKTYRRCMVGIAQTTKPGAAFAMVLISIGTR